MFPEHLISIDDLENDDINLILQRAALHENQKTVDTKNSREIALIFNEVSTRTFLSFSIAIKRLGYHSFLLLNSFSSLKKGESIADTLDVIAAMEIKIAVIRDSYKLTEHDKIGIINAGDSTYNHPSQALLDLYTITTQRFPINELEQKKPMILLFGDIVKSRVANSLVRLLSKFSFDIFLVDPYSEFISDDIAKFGTVVDRKDVKNIWKQADILYLLRPQKERHALNDDELILLNQDNFKELKHDCMIMHPGPITREIESCVKSRLVFPRIQVNSGVFIRMAIVDIMVEHHYGN